MGKYFVGLDMGSNSIGWAVTDPAYHIKKFNGVPMIGTRLFEESQTAAERRDFRQSRRLKNRRKFRISCLQMLFSEEISKKDIAFFQRLKESNLYAEDKHINGKYSLFADKDYTDADFYKEYPTIYHLRKELINNPEPHDVRLVYLALHHLVKNRGHFLFDDISNVDCLNGLENKWNELNEVMLNNYDTTIEVNDYSALEHILKNKQLSKTKKKDSICELLNISKKDKMKYSVIVALVGNKVKPADLFNDAQYKESEIKSVCVSSGYDENEAIYESEFGDNFELLEKIKAIFDWVVLADILNGHQYLSDAKVEMYEQHKADLKLLKKYVREVCPDKYNLIFKDKSVNNYAAYSKHSDNSCNEVEFCEFLRMTLPEEPQNTEYEEMYNKIANDIFMPKMCSKNNSVIPVQVTKVEVLAILNNAEKYLPFLLNKDEQGRTVSEKILDTFTFKIPYYVGPLNNKSPNSWISRTKEKIYPWNFEEVVDVEQSAENFITNITNKCTYIPTADVLPKNSLLYSAYMVLNELNNLKVNGEKISIELKQAIFNDLFLNFNKVSQSKVKKYISSYTGLTKVDISGIDGNFKSNLKPFRDLQAYNLTEEQKENVIQAITIFGDDKNLLRQRLKKTYSDRLNDNDIMKLSNISYKGWGKFSKEFLLNVEGLIADNGEVTNVITGLWDTNKNLMELVASKQNGFLKQLENLNTQEYKDIKEEIDDLYIAPKLKRPICQTIQIVDEIIRANKQVPSKIFIEVARGEEEKVRTISRKTKLLEIYSSCKKQYKDMYEEITKLTDADLRQDKLYLYYLQFGQCMYTGKKITFKDFSLYDIDHIFPQSKIKDDSIDNKVLVEKIFNNRDKANNYPLPPAVQSKMIATWNTLKDKGTLSQKKYDRLTRIYPLSLDELDGFINRQLVETRQSTKAVAQILKNRYPNTEIIYVKARLVSDFRHQYDFIKCREINDLHHAKDAYLNIVVGNVYNTRFNYQRIEYLKGLQKGQYNIKKLYNYNTKNAWVADNDESINIVKKEMNKNNIIFTRYASPQRGGLFDQNPLKKGFGQVSLKKNSALSDIAKYGGYNKAKSTCFAFVSYTNKKQQHIKAFVPIDLYKSKEYFDNPTEYLEKLLDASDVEIIVPRINYNTLLSVDGFKMHISGKSGNRILCKPAIQLVVTPEQESYIKKIMNYLNKCVEIKNIKEVTKYDHISKEENMKLFDTLINKMQTVYKVKLENLAQKILNNKAKFNSLSIYEQCYAISQILSILHCNVKTGDLTQIGGAKQSGIISIPGNISKITSLKIIHQSTTGLFYREQELLQQAEIITFPKLRTAA